MDNIPLQRLIVLMELSRTRKRRRRSEQRFAGPKWEQLCGLYDQVEANQMEQIEILLSMRRN